MKKSDILNNWLKWLDANQQDFSKIEEKTKSQDVLSVIKEFREITSAKERQVLAELAATYYEENTNLSWSPVILRGVLHGALYGLAAYGAWSWINDVAEILGK